jgi:hypothetical protein
MSMSANVGLAGVAIFIACTVTMHLVQPELNPIDDAVSYYMNGRLGWILGLGLVALGGGSLALADGLRRRMKGSRQALAGASLLGLWSLGAVIGGMFPPDPIGSWNKPPSLSGMIHGGAAMVAFLAFPIAAVLLSRAMAQVPESFGRAGHLKILALLSVATLVAFFACLAPAFVNRPPYVLGLVERVLLGFIVGWLVAAGLSMKRTSSGTSSAQIGMTSSTQRADGRT